MRGADVMQESLFTTVHLETFVPKGHPLRVIRALMDEALRELNGLFAMVYADDGRESIPPERLLRAQLLQVLYSIRSERQLVEQVQYNLLFRWFVGLSIDERVWDHSTFTKNRDRLLAHEVIPQLFAEVVALAERRDLLSKEHFSVDGTLIQAWASHKSYRPKDDDTPEPRGGGRNAERDFHGETRCNDTHASTTDPDARLFRKSKGEAARLCHMGHLLMENRNGLAVGATVTEAGTSFEWTAAVDLLQHLPGKRRKTVGADKGYDVDNFVAPCRALNITAHVASRQKGSRVDGRTLRHAGYALSQCIRKRIEEPFGWGKLIGTLRQAKVRGREKVNELLHWNLIGWNLVRLRTLVAETG